MKTTSGGSGKVGSAAILATGCALGVALMGGEAFGQKLTVTGDDPDPGAQNDVKTVVENTSATPETRRMMELVNNGSAQLIFRDNELGKTWSLNPVGDHFVVTLGGSGVQEFQVFENGKVEFRSAQLGNNNPMLILGANGNAVLAGMLTQNSSRETKKGIEPLRGSEVLAKLTTLDVAKWTYKADGSGARHVGPMAEDFHKAFGLGEDDKHVAASDVAGLSLAAAKELHRMIGQRDRRIAELEDRLKSLELQLADLASSKSPQIALVE